MVNPFISIDEQLADFGYVKLQEGVWGFTYAKHLGDGYVIKAECRDGRIKFYDPMVLGHDFDSAYVDEKELELFRAKIKEWRKQNERNSKNGRHYSKERS